MRHRKLVLGDFLCVGGWEPLLRWSVAGEQGNV